MSEDLEAREIAAEQKYVDEVYVQLDASTRNARALAAEGHSRGKLEHEGGLVERDAMVFQAAKRIAQLDAAHEGLVFGRLDLDASIDAQPRYIGRIGVRNADRDVLLIDWRAPAAGVFYQATAATPSGVVRRRVLRSLHRTVIGVEDELLDQEAETDLPIVGEGALMAQLSRARDRSMHSIVATIQAEQDQAIRAPGKGVVSISGGPGTGKTVVALHRAAFLLYSDRRRYEGGGVLVVGPSGVFMRYIERVLPSLGETAVALRSLGEVVGGIRATRHDEPAVADVKGATRMAELLRRTARQHAPGAPTSFRIYWRDETLVLDPGLLGRLRRQLMSQGRRNRQLPRVARTLLDAMWRQVQGERGRERGREAFEDDMLGHEGFVEFATALVAAARRAHGLRLAPRARLPRPGGRGRDQPRGAAAARQVVGVRRTCRSRTCRSRRAPLRPRRRPAAHRRRARPRRDRPARGRRRPAGAHHRSPSASTPPAGSPGPRRPTASRTTATPTSSSTRRRTSPRCSGGWSVAAAAPRAGRSSATPRSRRGPTPRRPPPPGPRRSRARSSTSSTCPPTTATPPRSTPSPPTTPAGWGSTPTSPTPYAAPVRSRGSSGRVDDLEAAVREAVTTTAGRVEGTVGIVVPVARRSEVNAWLASWPELADDAAGARAAVDSSVTPSGEDRVVVLTGLDTKGLEFDGIVVVSPQEIEDESATGRATLYVVLTRATQLLTTVG